MKPSKIISEKETKFPYDEGHKRDFRSCLLEYLDEQYERNKPCEHRETEVWNMDIGEVCKKCKAKVSR